MSQLIALTGATGFIGSSLLQTLTASGLSVRALVRRPGALRAQPGLELIQGDLDCPASLGRLVKDCDAVVHLAGAIAGRRYIDFARINAAGTARLVGAMERFQPGARLILVSSLAAREPQLSHYAASKRAAETLVESSALDWLILRPPAVYGPEDPALAPLWAMLARGVLLRAGPPEARFSLLHVDDLRRAILQLLEIPTLGGATQCLDDGKPGGYCWAEVAETAAAVRGRTVKMLPLPGPVLHTAARVNLMLSRLRTSPPVLNPGKVRELTHIDWVCDSKLACVLQPWSPQRTLESALPELPGWRQ